MLRSYDSTSAVIIQVREHQNVYGRRGEEVDDVNKAEVLQLGFNSNIHTS